MKYNRFIACFHKYDWLCHSDFLSSAGYQSFWLHIGRAASYWPYTFFTPRVFLFSIDYTAVDVVNVEIRAIIEKVSCLSSA